MFALLASLDLARYSPRCYVVAATDSGSAAKAHAFEASLQSHAAGSSYQVAVVRRSREARLRVFAVALLSPLRQVGQSYTSSVLTTLVALHDAWALVLSQRPQLLLCNGPGTCLPLAVACALLRCLRPARRRCGIVYVESIARVRRLSLTGLLLYHSRIADAFFVQWQQLTAKLRRARFLGTLM
jgi:beta-1,4-N-acetylglucosaminyltransferase